MQVRLVVHTLALGPLAQGGAEVTLVTDQGVALDLVPPIIPFLANVLALVHVHKIVIISNLKNIKNSLLMQKPSKE